MLELPSVWLPRRRIIRPGDADFRLPAIGPLAPLRAAIALEQASVTVVGGTGENAIQFGSVIPAGRLITVYVLNRSNGTTPPAATRAGWTTTFSHFPYEGDKSPGVLFAKIATGSADDGGVDGKVAAWTPCDGVIGGVWTGAASALASSTALGPPEVQVPAGFTVTRSAAPARAGGLALMASHLRNFSSSTQNAGGASIALGTSNPNSDFTAIMVYRLGGPGALQTQVDDTIGASVWEQTSAAAFDGPAGGSFSGEPGGGLWSG